MYYLFKRLMIKMNFLIKCFLNKKYIFYEILAANQSVTNFSED
jgi:hypothetical protein